MTYWMDADVLIRDMRPEDAKYFAREEQAQGWHTAEEKFQTEMQDAAAGLSVALTAEYKGQSAGYVSVYRNGTGGALAHQGVPEIVDFSVLQKYQRRGVGGTLMDCAESLAAGFGDTVYLGVGLHNGYGSAQRMYFKRGYMPDGTGAWYKDRPVTPYDTVYTVDDDLVLYLTKKLK